MRKLFDANIAAEPITVQTRTMEPSFLQSLPQPTAHVDALVSEQTSTSATHANNPAVKGTAGMEACMSGMVKASLAAAAIMVAAAFAIRAYRRRSQTDPEPAEHMPLKGGAAEA